MGKLKVNGSIEAVGNIVINAANNVDRFLHFDSTDSTGGYDWRIGYLGTGADNANYLVFQSTGNAGENWTSALRFGLNDLNATFAGNILPSVNNSKTIGSSSYKWNNIYATTFTGNLSGTASSASSAPWSGITSKPDYYPVRQSKSTASNYRPLLMHYVNGGYGADPGTANAQVYYNETIAACPSTGAIAATKFIGTLQGNASSASTCNGTALEWNGSIAWADTSWIAAWNADGTKIKALSKSSFAAASHTHSYLPLSGGTMTGTIVTPGNDSVVIKPANNNYDQIGASDCKFWKIYATTFYGNLSGNADTATTASAVAWANVTGKPSTFTPSSHTHSYIEAKGNYTFTSSTLPNSFDLGVSAGFVDSNAGFGSYGSVLTVRTYNGGGGSLQLYAPYSSSYGGTRLKARFGNYASSSGNSWTDLKELAWLSDLTWSNISGKPSTFTPASHTHSQYASIGAHNNLTASGNEFTFASSAFSGEMYINYRTASGSLDGNITRYKFQNGKGSNTAIECSYMYGTAQAADYATSAGYAGYLPSYTEYSTTSSLDGFLTNGVLRWAKATSAALSFGNDGSVISVGWGGGYGSQVWLDDGSGPAKIAVRNRNGGSSWNGWRHCVMSCSETYYGSSLPSSGNVGDVFFKI